MGDVKKKADPVQRRLDRIERMLRPARDRHWTIADIAAELQVSESTARSLLKLEGAPKPLALQTNKEGALLQPRYAPDRIRAWLADIDRASQPSRSAKSSASAR